MGGGWGLGLSVGAVVGILTELAKSTEQASKSIPRGSRCFILKEFRLKKQSSRSIKLWFWDLARYLDRLGWGS